LPVTSRQCWVYLDNQGDEYLTPGPGRTPYKRFNETKHVLPQPIGLDDIFEITKEPGDANCWIDVIETELSYPTHPSNLTEYLTITAAPYNAANDGSAECFTAFQTCINDAFAQSKNVFVPAGTYSLSSQLTLSPGVEIQGAGPWYSSLFFNNTGTGFNKGGIFGDGNLLSLKNINIKGNLIQRTDGYNGLQGNWGHDCNISNVWLEQVAAGMFLGDYDSPTFAGSGLNIVDCRARNCFADGINLAQGISYSTINNCHVRSAGDDGLAIFSSGYNTGKPMSTNNTIKNNTVECVYRAGGIGIFGGQGHQVYKNYVRNQIAGPGIRCNTVFVFSGPTQIGHGFGNEVTNFYNNELERTGSYGLYDTPTAAIELQTWYADVRNLNFNNITIDTTQYYVVRFSNLSAEHNPKFENIVLNNFTIFNASTGVYATTYATGSAAMDHDIINEGVNIKSPAYFSYTAI
jgi:hypothetical protein